MREHRIFHPELLQSDTELILADSAARHIVQVLRLKPGSAFVLFDGTGVDYAATLLKSTKQAVYASVGQILRREPAMPLQVHLALGISRGERMDFGIQKAVELGVSQIIPLFTERTLVQLKGEKLQTRLSHWQGVIQHACEQSGRSYLPALNPARSFGDFIGQCTGQGILLDHRAGLTLNQLGQPQKSVTLLVGPEGGLAQKERDRATRQGFSPVTLGPRILRTETAPLAALAAMQMLWGDFR